MASMNKFFNMLGIDVDAFEGETNFEAADTATTTTTAPPKRDKSRFASSFSRSSSSDLQVVIHRLTSFDSGNGVIDHLKEKKPVILNLELLENDPQGQRVLDLICGAAWALDAHMKEVSNGIFAITPKNIDIEEYLDNELENEDID